MNMSKVRSTLKQLERDWSSLRANERDQCYGPILSKLAELFPDRQTRHKVNVLNPGCGLARLPCEIAKLGFSSQGNEFSYFMLLTSHFVLNKCQVKEGFILYPFCEITTNQWCFDEDAKDANNGQMARVAIPDIPPHEMLESIQDL